MGNHITIDAEIDLGDLYTDDLISELKRRKKFDKNFINDLKEGLEEDIEIEINFDTPGEVLNHLRKIFHLRPFHGKERIIQEIQDL